MIRVSTTEFSREAGRDQNAALSQPVVVTSEGQDTTVTNSVEADRRPQRRDREVLGRENFTDADIEAVRRAEPSPEAEGFNHELEF